MAIDPVIVDGSGTTVISAGDAAVSPSTPEAASAPTSAVVIR